MHFGKTNKKLTNICLMEIVVVFMFFLTKSILLLTATINCFFVSLPISPLAKVEEIENVV